MWNSIKSEPVRWFAGLNALIPLAISGLTVFDVWEPSTDQLGWLYAAPVTLGAMFGVTVVRNAVTPVKGP
jgi:hypothetical protein